MTIYQVISEERDMTIGTVIFEGTLSECYEFRRKYKGNRYPSLSQRATL